MAPRKRRATGKAAGPKKGKDNNPPSSGTALDAAFYPHIMETILRQAPHAVLVAFRGTCRRFRDLADQHMAHHIVHHPHEISSGGGRMPAVSNPSLVPIPRSLAEKLYPNTRFLEVKAHDCANTPVSWSEYMRNVEVLRLHMTGFPANLRSDISPRTVVYTTSTMTDVTIDGCRSLVMPDRKLPPSTARVVVNVPWTASDTKHYYGSSLFSHTNECVVIFVARPLAAIKTVENQPDVLKPLLRAFATQLHSS